MKTCQVLDVTKNGKVIYSLSLGVLEVQFGKCKEFQMRKGLRTFIPLL